MKLQLSQMSQHDNNPITNINPLDKFSHKNPSYDGCEEFFVSTKKI